MYHLYPPTHTQKFPNSHSFHYSTSTLLETCMSVILAIVCIINNKSSHGYCEPGLEPVQPFPIGPINWFACRIYIILGPFDFHSSSPRFGGVYDKGSISTCRIIAFDTTSEYDATAYYIKFGYSCNCTYQFYYTFNESLTEFNCLLSLLCFINASCRLYLTVLIFLLVCVFHT